MDNPFMLKKHLRKLIGNWRRKKKCSDTKILKRDVICMSKTFPQEQLKSNSKNYSLNTERLKTSNCSPRMESQLMPLCASRTQRRLHKQKLSSTNRLSMESNFTSTIMKLRRSEKYSMRSSTTRLISKTTKNKTLVTLLISSISLRYMLS